MERREKKKRKKKKKKRRKKNREKKRKKKEKRKARRQKKSVAVVAVFDLEIVLAPVLLLYLLSISLLLVRVLKGPATFAQTRLHTLTCAKTHTHKQRHTYIVE